MSETDKIDLSIDGAAETFTKSANEIRERANYIPNLAVLADKVTDVGGEKAGNNNGKTSNAEIERFTELVKEKLPDFVMEDGRLKIYDLAEKFGVVSPPFKGSLIHQISKIECGVY